MIFVIDNHVMAKRENNQDLHYAFFKKKSNPRYLTHSSGDSE